MAAKSDTTIFYFRIPIKNLKNVHKIFTLFAMAGRMELRIGKQTSSSYNTILDILGEQKSGR